MTNIISSYIFLRLNDCIMVMGWKLTRIALNANAATDLFMNFITSAGFMYLVSVSTAFNHFSPIVAVIEPIWMVHWWRKLRQRSERVIWIYWYYSRCSCSWCKNIIDKFRRISRESHGLYKIKSACKINICWIDRSVSTCWEIYIQKRNGWSLLRIC